MLKSRSKVAAIVARYVNALNQRGIEVERAYLFGSYLRGTPNEWSDIDVVIISSDFGRLSLLERTEITGLARYHTFQATGESVEALAKTPEEVTNAHPASFLADILKKAVVLYERVPAHV